MLKREEVSDAEKSSDSVSFSSWFRMSKIHLFGTFFSTREKNSLFQGNLQDEDRLMRDDLDNAEKLVFDFEAYPVCDGDKGGLINLLTQAFFFFLFFWRTYVEA